MAYMSVGKHGPAGRTMHTCIRLRQYDLQGCLDFLGLGALVVFYTTIRGLEERQLGYQEQSRVLILTSVGDLAREKTSWLGM